MGISKIFSSTILIFIVGFAVYANSLDGSFIWDDENLIRDNIYIKSWSHTPVLFTSDIGKGAGREYDFYRPVQMLTYRLDYCLWRLEPQGYRLTNVILHCLVGLAVFRLIYIFFSDYLLSLLTSAIFVVHPVHTSAVAYISGRADLLALLFVLISLTSYVRYMRSKDVIFLWMAIPGYILALLSKENSLLLPLLILLYHYSFKEKIRVRLFLSMVAISLVYVTIRFTLLKSLLVSLSHAPSLLERLPGFFAAIPVYVRLLVLPLNLHMEYGNRLFTFSEPKAIAGIIIMALSLIYIFGKKRERGQVFFSISWFLLTLSPASHIYPLNAYMAEHWLYASTIGFSLLIALPIISLCRTRNQPFDAPRLNPPTSLGSTSLAMLRAMLSKSKLGTKGCDLAPSKYQIFHAAVVTFLILMYFSYLTVRQCEYWKDPIFFFKRTLTYAPNNIKMYTGLGNAYNAVGKYEEAIDSYQKALGIDPNYSVASFNLGNSYHNLKRYGDAIASYLKAIDSDPNYEEAYNNLANVYSDIGQNDKAIELYKKAIQVNSSYSDPYHNLGNQYRRSGDYERAIESYKKALEINPADAITHNNIAVSYYFEKQYDLAVEHCDKAIELGLSAQPEFLETLRPYRDK